MRSALAFVALLPLLIAVDIALWAAAPERQLMRSAALAGIVVGRLVRGAAW